MKVYYYFNPSRLNKDKIVIQKIRGDEIKYIYEKPWLVSGIFKEGDILICSSIDELADCEEKLIKDGQVVIDQIAVNQLVDEYMKLLDKGIELSFDKSTQCDSLFIKTLIADPKDFKITLKKCILNYLSQKNIEMNYLRKHVIIAESNGSKLGIKKGTKLITKKSIETKKQILKLSRDFNGTMSNEDLIKELGISRNVYYKYKKELKEEL